MAVPLYDTISVVLIRLREGRSPFQGDRRHFSHRLVARGLTPPQAVWTIDLVTLAGGLGALLLHRLDAWGAALVMAQTCCLLGVVAILELARSRPEPGQANGRMRCDTRASDDQARDRRLLPRPVPVSCSAGGETVASLVRRTRADSSEASRRGSASGSAGWRWDCWRRLVTARALLAQRARPGAGSGSGLVWVLLVLVRGRAGHRRRADRRPVPVPLVVDRRRGAGAHVPGRSERPRGLDRRLAINLAWEWAGLGFAYILAAQPAADPRRVEGPCGRAGGHGRGRLGLWAVPGAGRDSPTSGAVPEEPAAGLAGGATCRWIPRESRPSRTACSARSEVFATFGLANSLAGFLVGPLVLVAGDGPAEPGRSARHGARPWA